MPRHDPAPPTDEDRESVVLARLLWLGTLPEESRDRVGLDAVGRIPPRAFFGGRLRSIFEAIRDLAAERGALPPPVDVVARMGERGQLEAKPGSGNGDARRACAAELSGIMDYAAGGRHEIVLPDDVRSLIEAHGFRELAAAAELLRDAAVRRDRNADVFARRIARIAVGGTEAWSRPVPFDRPQIVDFPADALSAPLAEMALATAEDLQVPIDLAGAGALAVASAACSGTFDVEARNGWVEPCNLYVVAVANSGERKSGTLRALVAPLVSHEERERERAAPEVARRRTALDIQRDRLAAAKKRAATAAAGSDREAAARDAQELAANLSSAQAPALPRLLADDVTSEGAAVLLAEHGSIAVMSPEGGILSTIAGRYSAGVPNLDVWLKGHAVEPLRVDRASPNHPPVTVAEPRLTLLLMIQPDVLAGLAKSTSFRGCGFLARIAFVLPAPRVGRRRTISEPTPPAVRDAYAATLERLLVMPRNHAATRTATPRLRFSTGALAELNAYRTRLEPRLGEGGDLAGFADWGSKLPGLIVRISGVLHLADEAHAGRFVVDGDEVQVDVFRRAERIGDALLCHARAAFGVLGADPLAEDARAVVASLRRLNRRRVTKRELFQANKGRTSLSRVSALDPVLELLVGHGFLREVEAAPRARGQGRAPSAAFDVNPHALDASFAASLDEFYGDSGDEGDGGL